jgi:dCMP deaminase
MIVGLTGILGCGKGSVGKILVGKGFTYTSLSDVIREVILEKGEMITRDNLTKTAKSLREEGGFGILAKMLIPKLDKDKDFVVDSFRHPDEVNEFRKTFDDFILINVDAPLDICLKRIVGRNRENDPKNMSELKIQLNKENNDNNQRLNDTIKLADKTIINDKTLDELKKSVEDLLKENGRL